MIKKSLQNFIASLLLMFFSILPCFAIKIGLAKNLRSSYIGTSTKGYAVDGHSGKTLFYLKPMHRYRVKRYKNTVAIKMEDGKYYNSGTNYLIVNAPNGFVSTKEKWYRGTLIVQKRSSGLTLINDVGIESYILGVVPSEMPPSWSIEAHKAQAIAARSYAIANLGKRSASGYDLKDTPEDQAYGGATAETPKTTKAVLNTKGKVLVYNHKIIPAYYHSSAGGKTTTAAKVWNKDLPYIHSVKSYDSRISKNGHGVGMSQHGANFLAKKGYNCYQILNYFYKNVALGTIKTR